MLSDYFHIHIEKKKGLIGLVLGLGSLILLYLCRNVYIGESNQISYGYLMGVPFFFLFLLTGFLRIDSQNSRVIWGLNLLWNFVMALGTIFWAMAAVEAIGIWRMDLLNFCLAIGSFFVFACILYALTGKWRQSMNVAVAIQSLVAVINSYVFQFRGREILFLDLNAAGTALTVMKEYTPVFSLRMALGVSVLALAAFCQFSIPKIPPVRRKHTRSIAVGAAVGIVLATVLCSPLLTTQVWGGDGSWINGFYVNFFLSMRDSFIKKPDGYSREAMQALEAQYPQNPQRAQLETRPDIVVIMNESFADLRVLGENLRTNQPVMPYWDSLEENTIKGYALSSVYGGGTANSEFEFLTGHSMAFLPTGSTPYQQYISSQRCSLAWLLQEQGYQVMATHPYYAKGWSREQVYPLLGFSVSTFIEDYPREKMMRKWISDQEMYEYLLRKLDVDSGQPQFIFGITMQNHGGYLYDGDDFVHTIELEGYNKEYPKAEQYLTLIQESDKALEFLLTKLDERQQDTIVLFFGDHLPGIDSDFYGEINGGSFETLDDQQLKYTVPFLIWANFDIPEERVACTSLNYLSRYLLETAGFELPAYYQFLKEAEEKIPALSAQGYYSLSQGGYIPVAEAQGEEKEWLNRYAMLQYNALFEKNGSSDVFFGHASP